MRTLCLLAGVMLISCGSSGGTTKPTARASAAKDSVGPPAYCDGYRGCAHEKAQMAWNHEHDTPPSEAELTPEVDAEIERCRGIVGGLSAEQATWLEACTGCGGSCDVYHCLDSIPEDAKEPFHCDLFGPDPEH